MVHRIIDAKTRLKRVGLAALLTTALAAPGMAGEPTAAGDTPTPIETLTLEMGGQLDALDGLLSDLRRDRDGLAEAAPVIRLAQSGQDAAAFNVRLSQIEEQMRVLTGQIEGLQFQLTQMQTLIERMREDNEFRFQQLEGGASLGNSDAATQPGGETPSGGLPQDPAQADDFISEEFHDEGDFDELGEFEDFDMHGGVDLGDPAILGGEIILGAPPQELGTLPEGALRLPEGGFTGEGQAFDLEFDSGLELSQEDADTQYRVAYEAVVRGDYDHAEAQFRQFVSEFPNHPNAPDATNWLGESLLQRGEYDAAAEVLLVGFESYPESPRAPDMLFRLGQALAGAGETDTACRMYEEVLRRYPGVPPAFQTRVADEQGLAQCG